MAPTTAVQQNENPEPANHEVTSHSGPNITTILVTTIVVVAFAIIGIAAFLFYNRQGGERQYREACKNDPYLTRKEFARRKRLSATQRIEEDEMQRSIMIRKSLTSRTSSYPVDNTDSDSELNLAMAQVPHSNLNRYDEWAPSTRRGRTASGKEPHPGMEIEIPLPPKSRSPSPSPSRGPLLRQPERSISPPPHPNEFGRPYHGLPSTLHQLPSFEAASREMDKTAVSGVRNYGSARRESSERLWFA
ncbi:hypothetical protein ACHAQA_009758 [Verticillium albo-atrum]